MFTYAFSADKFHELLLPHSAPAQCSRNREFVGVYGDVLNYAFSADKFHELLLPHLAPAQCSRNREFVGVKRLMIIYIIF